MQRLVIQLAKPLKAKLDALRMHGFTCSGFIRSMLEREFADSRGSPHTAEKQQTQTSLTVLD